MRLLFAGTPEVAVPALDALIASDHEVVAVLTRPDGTAGRGRKVVPSPVKARALEAGIEVLTPTSLRDEAVQEQLRALDVDAAPVVAYGNLVPAAALAIPRLGWVNLHFSLLPAWRGAAPVQRAIMAGDELTGASTFLLEEGLDTGPVIGTMVEPVRERDTAGDLLTRLADAGAGLLLASLDALADGSAAPRPQPEDGISLAPKITVEQARVDWAQPAFAVDRLVRGCTPEPGAWTTFRGERLGLGPVVPVERTDLAPGQIEATKKQVHVGTTTGAVLLGTVRPQGKKHMAAADWARGVRITEGEVVGG